MNNEELMATQIAAGFVIVWVGGMVMLASDPGKPAFRIGLAIAAIPFLKLLGFFILT